MASHSMMIEALSPDAALVYACEYGDPKLILRALRKGGKNYNLSLLAACQNDSSNGVMFMIRYATNQDKCLSIACGLGHTEICKILIVHGKAKHCSKCNNSKHQYTALLSLFLFGY